MSLTAEILTQSPLLDADDIEGEIGNLIHSARRRAPDPETSHHQLPPNEIPHQPFQPNHDQRFPKGSMPDYVEHKEGVNQVGSSRPKPSFVNTMLQ